MSRKVVRAMVALALALLVGLGAVSAMAGSYLNRAALLLDGSRSERDLVRSRSNDKELVELVHEIAEARTAAALRMDVPKQVTGAHPHLLLVLENTERAYAAALAGNFEKFSEHLLRAHTEDRTFRALVARLGYSLPSVAPR